MPKQQGYALLVVMLISACIAAQLLNCSFIAMHDIKSAYLFKKKMRYWDSEMSYV